VLWKSCFYDYIRFHRSKKFSVLLRGKSSTLIQSQNSYITLSAVKEVINQHVGGRGRGESVKEAKDTVKMNDYES